MGRNGFSIGIIGGTRGMGQWFARFLEQEGYKVVVSGRSSGPDIPTLARDCRVVVVSVPISVTCRVVEEVGPCMQEDALLMDLTSLKEAPVEAMLKATRAEVIGLHPLFGPDVDSLEGHKVVICPARTVTWRFWLMDLLTKNGAVLIETTPQKHDALMAIIQGLNHLNTITLAMIVKESGVDPAELKRFATPSFHSKIALMEKIFGHNPRLYAEIITLNPQIHPVLELYEKALSEAKAIVSTQEPEAFSRLMNKNTFN